MIKWLLVAVHECLEEEIDVGGWKVDKCPECVQWLALMLFSQVWLHL
jgi:hypothetical protein